MATWPNFTAIIPTIGRDTLRRTLDSIAQQELVAGDQVIIVQDSLSDIKPEVPALVAEYDNYFQYEEYSGTQHAWGTPQRMWALHNITTPDNFVLWIDDTDVYLPNAWHNMRMLIEVNMPHIFGCIAYWGLVPGYEIKPGKIGGHNFVSPHVAGKWGEWTYSYTGDFDFIESTLAKWDNKARWHELIVTDIRGGYNGMVTEYAN